MPVINDAVVVNRSEKIRLKKESQFQEKISTNYTDFSIQSSYIKSSLKVKIKHEICGSVFERKPDYIYMNGLTCPECYKNSPSRLRKSPTKFKKEFENVYGKSLILNSDYTHGEEKISVKCLQGHVWLSSPLYLLKGKGCPNCNKDKFVSPLKKSHEQFVCEMKNKYGDEYEILGDYDLFNKKVLTRHNPCGHEWKPIASNLYSNGSCPKCHQSKGEKEIRKYLLDNSLEFENEYAFDDCRGEKYSLRFDFCIFKDRNVWFLIEYDGEFHFKENKIYKNESVRKQKFRELKNRDFIKTEYCENKKIPLLRIPYWDKENITDIIRKFTDELLSRKEVI